MGLVWDHLKSMFWTAAGYVVLGLFLPLILYVWNFPRSTFMKFCAMERLSEYEVWLKISAYYLYSSLTMIPLGVLFIILILGRLQLRVLQEPEMSFAKLAWLGASWGFAASFVNLPAYLIFGKYTFSTDYYWSMKTVLMFFVSGATTGWWAAWQAWRCQHEHVRFWPQISLKWMVIVMVRWAALMAVFRPVE